MDDYTYLSRHFINARNSTATSQKVTAFLNAAVPFHAKLAKMTIIFLSDKNQLGCCCCKNNDLP